MAATANCAVTNPRPGLISFDEATRLIARHAKPLGVEKIPLWEADGRILAAPAIAKRTSPPQLVSAMDGYAVRDADVAQLPASLKIVGKSFAGGGCPQPLLPGSCVRIFT